MMHGSTFEVLQLYSVFAKDTTLLKLRLKLCQKADSFPQRLRDCLSLCVVTCGSVVRSSTGSPTVFRPMSSSATVLARVDVCRARVGRAGRTVSFLVVGFAFSLSLTFLKRVDLHPVIICARYVSSCQGRIRSKVSDEWHHCNEAARRAALLGHVPNCKLFLRKIGAILIITVYLTASANAVPEARSHSPTSSSQALKPDSKPSAWSRRHRETHIVDSTCVAHICCVSDDMPQLRWIPQRIGQEFGHCHSFSRPVHGTSVHSISDVHLQALALLSGRSDSARLRTCPFTCKRQH